MEPKLRQIGSPPQTLGQVGFVVRDIVECEGILTKVEELRFT
jgi:hypothetical protein